MRSLLHISDIHFGPKHLPDRAAGVVELVRQREPDVVVVSGDLTQRAKPHQFAAARRFLEQIPAPVLAVPGNHDVPLYRAWERALMPFGAYRRHFDRELEPVFADPSLFVVGVNSAHNWTLTGGRVSGRARRRLRRRLESAPAGAYRVAVIHHHLLPHPEVAGPRRIRQAGSLLDLLLELEVDLVLSGHLHHSFRLERYSERDADGRRHGLVILHCGTTCSSRGRGEEAGGNSCHWIEVGAEEGSAEVMLWADDAATFSSARRLALPRSIAVAAEPVGARAKEAQPRTKENHE